MGMGGGGSTCITHSRAPIGRGSLPRNCVACWREAEPPVTYYRFGALISINDKVEYTDVSRLKRLWLEDSFLLGALQEPYIVIFHAAVYFTRKSEMSPIPGSIINTSHNSID
jgi:hypothetical protein